MLARCPVDAGDEMMRVPRSRSSEIGFGEVILRHYGMAGMRGRRLPRDSHRPLLSGVEAALRAAGAASLSPRAGASPPAPEKRTALRGADGGGTCMRREPPLTPRAAAAVAVAANKRLPRAPAAAARRSESHPPVPRGPCDSSPEALRPSPAGLRSTPGSVPAAPTAGGPHRKRPGDASAALRAAKDTPLLSHACPESPLCSPTGPVSRPS
jgi:hypothetical protein